MDRVTASPQTALGYWCRKVASMKPGEHMMVSIHALSDIPSFEHNGATFTPADRVLGNILGSAWTHSFVVRDFENAVEFICYEDTGERRHCDPDRRPSLLTPSIKG